MPHLNNSKPDVVQPIRADLKIVSDRVSESFGSVLKLARERKGYSQADVAKSIYITEHVVRAIEEQRFDKLPEDTYTKGYIRSYAALVDLNPEGLVKDFSQGKELLELNEQDRLRKDKKIQEEALKQQSPALDKVIYSSFGRIPFFKKQYRGYFVFLMTGIILGILVIVPFMKNSEIAPAQLLDKVKVLNAQGSIVVSDLMHQPEVTSVVGSSQATSLPVMLPLENTITLNFLDTTWVTLRNSDKEVIHQSRKQKGERLELSGQSPFYLRLSKASAVQLSLDNTPVDFSDQISADDQLHDFVILP